MGDLAGESRLLTGWGRTAPTRAEVTTPAARDWVARAIEDAGPRGVVARGLGRSYGDAAQNAGGRVVAMESLASVRSLDADDGIATVEAGISLGQLSELTLPLGWFVPVTPGTRHVTVGGAIASDVHGKNHHRDGSFSDHVLSFELQTPAEGCVTVTRKSEPELFRATAGGMGLTGIVLEATVRLLPVPSAYLRVDRERARDLDDVMARMETGDEHYRYSVAWIDCIAQGRQLGRSVLIRADHATPAEAADAGRNGSFGGWAPARVASPPWVPSGLLRRSTVRAFNEAYFRRAPAEERGRVEPLQPFFYPLDGVANWNRMYGRHGFVQYQFVVPLDRGDTLREALERLSASGYASFLAVLKRMGEGNGGPLSFPIAGWTLALDMPAEMEGLAPLLDGLDELVAEAGGRVFLAKDSRLHPDALRAMYPDLDALRAVRERVDPRGVMRSDLARRLAIA